MKQTLENLTKAFIGESQARNRYTLYAKVAKKEKYHQIADIFIETAEQERQHAKWLFRMIQELKEKMGENPESIFVEAEAPLTLAGTAENIKAAIAGEHYETTEMYPEFALAAKKDGLDDMARRLNAIGRAEKHHEDRYLALLEQVEQGTMHKKESSVTWVCPKCGYTAPGQEPPQKCPACDHSREYFYILCEEY
ncbi:MAG TPA: rubrerythrin family protein [Methanobacteriaceae archaeon]|nr:rubrerythrin family protein [Methanobacteriaceae archaeon]